MNLEDRAQLYNSTFPNYPPLVVTDRWIYGIWMIGNNYQSKNKYYGEYPPSYLKRIRSLFPDCKCELHLFSGSMDNNIPGTRFDINTQYNPDVIGDAHKLSSYFLPNSFDIIYADPPYSSEDAKHYGTPMIGRNKVIREAIKVLKPGGFIIWLDQVLPMYRKVELILIGTVGLVRSTNHRFRIVCIFQKTD